MLQVREQRVSQATLLLLTGQFDHHSTVGLEAMILGAKEVGSTHVILDFAGITEMDTHGLGQLFRWCTKLHPHQLKLSIGNPVPQIREVLEMSGIAELVPVYVSEQGALADPISKVPD